MVAYLRAQFFPLRHELCVRSSGKRAGMLRHRSATTDKPSKLCVFLRILAVLAELEDNNK